MEECSLFALKVQPICTTSAKGLHFFIYSLLHLAFSYKDNAKNHVLACCFYLKITQKSPNNAINATIMPPREPR